MPDAPPDVLARIFDLLRRECGIDFTGYKENTVGRRIQRRLLLTHSGDLAQYLDRIAQDPVELRSLYCDLLIGVTRFFRDEEAFQLLDRDVLPGLIDALGKDDELRVWVAGCATGEEPYSLAMAIAEAFRRRERPADVPRLRHRRPQRVAGAGQRRRLFDREPSNACRRRCASSTFNRIATDFQITPELRSHVVFAHHNLLRDAPFTRIDLVSCRNLLIYFSPSMQRKALTSFHFALKVGGTLLLGPSESPASLGDEFAVVDGRWKLFRKVRDSRILPEVRGASPLRVEPPGGPRRPTEDGRVSRSRELLLQEYGPPSLLVDGDLRLLHTFNAAERAADAEGRAPVAEPARPGRRRAARGAGGFDPARPARPDAGASRRRVGHDAEGTAAGARGGSSGARPRAQRRRVGDQPGAERHRRARRGGPHEIEGSDRGELMTERIAGLEGELRYAKENLQATIEEMETSNEELQATNEELVASNEELQSTNEELHSVNEELYTVNAEYQTKIAELTELTADMTHLLEATEVHTLFVDRDLRLRKFTPKIGEAFHLLPQDVGRRLDSFAHDIDDENLLPDLGRVLASGITIEREVRDVAGNSYFLRILPYRVGAKIDGVVLTLDRPVGAQARATGPGRRARALAGLHLPEGSRRALPARRTAEQRDLRCAARADGGPGRQPADAGRAGRSARGLRADGARERREPGAGGDVRRSRTCRGRS